MDSVPASSSPSPKGGVRVDKPTNSISDVILNTFAPFDHQHSIIEPFDDEAKRDAEFQEKLSEMLLELILEFHAWSTSRPAHESDTTADKLEKEINALLEMEKEQGRSSAPSLHTPLGFVERTRQRLCDFVERIKMALAVLTEM